MFFHPVDKGSISLVLVDGVGGKVGNWGGVVFVLVRRPRRVVEEECVTLMSCCPRTFFKVLEREEW